MKKLLFFFCLVQSLAATAQSNDTTKYTPVGGYGYTYKRLKVDSSLMLAMGDNTNKAPRQIKFVGNNIFYSDNAGVWHALATGGSGGGQGISSIYNRGDSLFYTLNGAEYFVYAYFTRDSADARYYSITNPAGYLTSAVIAGKVNYTDTALMLSPYLHKGDTALMLNPYLHKADTAAMLNPYLHKGDTALMLSPYLHKADTTAMLNPYLHKADTALMLTPYLHKADTAAMLNPYLHKGDTALMLNPYLHKADTAAMLSPYLTTAAGNTRYPLLSGSYSNPTWVNSLAWGKLTGTPTTLGGYGITDAYSNTNPAGYITSTALAGYVPAATTLSINGTAYDLSANRSWSVPSLPSQTGNGGRYLTTDGNNASWANVSASGATPHYYGSIYNKNSWTDLSDFVLNNITATVSSNKIVLTAASGLSTFDYNYYSLLDHWSNAAKIKVNSTSATAGVGIHSVSSWQGFSVYAKLNMSTGALTIVNANTLPSYAETTIAASASNLTIAANDYVIISIERDVDTVFATARDVTSGSSIIKCAFGYQTSSTTTSTPNTGMYAIYGGGGSFTIDSMSVTSNEIINSNLLITTDSKGEYVANSFQSRWTQQVSNLYYPTVLSVGGTEGVTDLLHRVPEIIALAPKSVLILVGRNDQNFFLNSDTLHNRYLRAVGYLQAAGITVYHLNEIYETAINLSGLSNWKNTTFPGYVIDTYDPTSQVTGLIYSDDSHQVQAGHDLVAKIVIQSGVFNKGLNYGNIVRFANPAYPISLSKFGGNQFIGDAGNNTLTTATSSLGWGTNTLTSLTTGLFNWGAGINAGHAETMGNRNIYLGSSAGYQSQGGSYGIYIGDHAGVNSLDASTHTVANRSIFIGAWGGSNISTDANDNVFIGNYAGQFLPGPVSNTFVVAGGSASGTGGTYGVGSGSDGFDLIYGNFNGGQLRVGKNATGSSLIAGVALDVTGGALKLPSNPGGITSVDGMMFYDYANHRTYWYNGTANTSNVLPKFTVVSTSSSNTTMLPNGFYILNPTTSLSSLTLELRSGSYASDNDVVEFVATKNITGVTYFVNGGGANGLCPYCPTSLAAGVHYKIVYNSADLNWY